MCDRPILMVEDNKWFARAVTEVLKASDFLNVIWVQTGEEAVDYCADPTHDIDMVLMDIVLPEMSGYDAMDQIRVIRPGLPMVAMSGTAIEKDINVVHEPFWHGARDILDKNSGEQFFARLKMLVQKWVIEWKDLVNKRPSRYQHGRTGLSI